MKVISEVLEIQSGSVIVWTFVLNNGFKKVTKPIEVGNMKTMACDGITMRKEAFNMCSSNAKMIILCYVSGQFQEKEANNFL